MSSAYLKTNYIKRQTTLPMLILVGLHERNIDKMARSLRIAHIGEPQTA